MFETKPVDTSDWVRHLYPLRRENGVRSLEQGCVQFELNLLAHIHNPEVHDDLPETFAEEVKDVKKKAKPRTNKLTEAELVIEREHILNSLRNLIQKEMKLVVNRKDMSKPLSDETFDEFVVYLNRFKKLFKNEYRRTMNMFKLFNYSRLDNYGRLVALQPNDLKKVGIRTLEFVFTK
jgi:hypothetical protein